MEDRKIPAWEKITITVDEAANLTNIGKTKIYDLMKERDCDFALQVGKKILIKREPFIRYLMKKSVL